MKKRIRAVQLWCLLRVLVVMWWGEALWRFAVRRELEFFMLPIFVHTKADQMSRQVASIARRNSPEGQRALAKAKAKRERKRAKLMPTPAPKPKDY